MKKSVVWDRNSGDSMVGRSWRYPASTSSGRPVFVVVGVGNALPAPAKTPFAGATVPIIKQATQT